MLFHLNFKFQLGKRSVVKMLNIFGVWIKLDEDNNNSRE